MDTAFDAANSQLGDCKKQNDALSDSILVSSLVMSNGRGRIGRQWCANKVGNINLSLVPNILLSNNLTVLPIMLATSVGSAIGIDSTLGFSYKWPNDLLFNGKKFGGVLVEIRNGILVIGIGINIHIVPPVPDIEVTSLANEGLLGVLGDNISDLTIDNQMHELSNKIAEQIMLDMSELRKGLTDKFIQKWSLKAWKKTGDKVDIKIFNKKESGVFVRIDDTGRIIINRTDSSGNIVTSALSYGDVS